MKKLVLFSHASLRGPGLMYCRRDRPSLACFLAVVFFVLSPISSTSLWAQPDTPSLLLWAWERRENLSFIDPHRIGVAYLAGTVYLRGTEVEVRPRLQPLRLPDGTNAIAVVRVERHEAVLSPDQCGRCAAEIIGFLPLQRMRSLQIDFDASVSERPFYATLLSCLRSRLPKSCGLSMTALASWCTWDDWLSDLPVEATVPMLFRMGRDRDSVIRSLQENGCFRAKKCRGCVGISADEPVPYLPPCEKVFVFNPHPWSSTELYRVTEEVKRWREKH